jgi:ferritin
MKLDPVMLEALVQQANRERQNSVPYQAMANRCQLFALFGLTKFFRTSAGEELEHAQKITDYVIGRNDAVDVLPLQGANIPATSDLSTVGSTLLSVALALEEANTEKIKLIYRMAQEAGDYQTVTVLHWFLEEQTRSCAELIDMVGRWTFAAGCPAAVLQLDHELEG